VGSKRRIFSAPDCVLAVQGRSGSSKVDDFGTNRKRVYDFLLVRHRDCGPVLHRFRDMVTYWLKVAYFCYRRSDGQTVGQNLSQLRQRSA